MNPVGPFSFSRSLRRPSLPWLRTTLPRATRSGLFNDLEIEAPLQLHPRGAEDDPDGSRRPSLLADHLAEVLRGDFELEDGGLFSLELGNLHAVRLVHQRLGNE